MRSFFCLFRTQFFLPRGWDSTADRPIERARGASVSAGLARTFRVRRSYYRQALARPACLVDELDHARAVVFLAGSTGPGIDVAYLAAVLAVPGVLSLLV